MINRKPGDKIEINQYNYCYHQLQDKPTIQLVMDHVTNSLSLARTARNQLTSRFVGVQHNSRSVLILSLTKFWKILDQLLTGRNQPIFIKILAPCFVLPGSGIKRDYQFHGFTYLGFSLNVDYVGE
jgi:hypothetical protein